ncbi:MAG TPA: DUF5984 family protein [Roseateles sp.]
MNGPLFDFRLRPLDEIQPWGAPEDPNLHWFGLSDGCYWLNVGEQRLLEYSTQLQAEFGFPRCCDYQVVRLHEDVLDMLPEVLTPAPPELREFAERGREYLDAWASPPESEAEWARLDHALTWLDRRTLSSRYLSPGARIWMWSDEPEVHVQWDNRGINVHGVPAWSARCGSFSLSRADFVAEAKRFHERFMQQMAERVRDLLATGAPPRIRIDLDGLEREQRRRETLSELNFQPFEPTTPWSTVITAVQELEARRTAALRPSSSTMVVTRT